MNTMRNSKSKVRILTSVSRLEHTAKPSGAEIGRIQNSTRNEYLTIPEIGNILFHGGTIRPAALEGTKGSGFISSQILAVDIDDARQMLFTQGITRAMAAGYSCNIVYRTYSDKSPEFPRFRLLSVLDRPLTDVNQWRHCQRKFMEVFEGQADLVCKDPGRLFFGSCRKNPVFDHEMSFTSADALLADYVPPAPKTAKIKPKRTPETAGREPDEQVIDAIRRHDAAALRELFPLEPYEAQNTAAFFNYLYRISLADFLQVDEGRPFRCLFHEDGHPSASIFQTSRGLWLYHCHSGNCRFGGKNLTIRGVIEEIGQFRSPAQSIRFMKDAFQVTIRETEWTREMHESIDYMRHFIFSNADDSMQTLAPQAAANFRYSTSVLATLLQIADENILPERETTDGSLIISISARQLARAAGRSINKVMPHMRMAAYHHIVIPIPDSAVPEPLLKKAKKVQAQRGTSGFLIQFYEIPEWLESHVITIEERAQKWKAGGYRLRHLSREEFLRTEGEEVAALVYPKTYRRKPCIKAEQTHERLAELITGMIAERGYCTEQQAIDALVSEGCKRTVAEAQVQRSLMDIMQSNCLRRVRLNKELKNKYEIESRGFPFVLIADEVLG